MERLPIKKLTFEKSIPNHGFWKLLILGEILLYFFANEILLRVSFSVKSILLMRFLGECNVVLNPRLAS